MTDTVDMAKDEFRPLMSRDMEINQKLLAAQKAHRRAHPVRRALGWFGLNDFEREVREVAYKKIHDEIQTEPRFGHSSRGQYRC